jgi:hypothetical protein
MVGLTLSDIDTFVKKAKKKYGKNIFNGKSTSDVRDDLVISMTKKLNCSYCEYINKKNGSPVRFYCINILYLNVSTYLLKRRSIKGSISSTYSTFFYSWYTVVIPSWV